MDTLRIVLICLLIALVLALLAFLLVVRIMCPSPDSNDQARTLEVISNTDDCSVEIVVFPDVDPTNDETADLVVNSESIETHIRSYKVGGSYVYTINMDQAYMVFDFVNQKVVWRTYNLNEMKEPYKVVFLNAQFKDVSYIYD